ncbi:MAG: hypothetical protein GEU83_17845 [Pseudonocardiaceae bacterium]|nr:hypothetical protein [Pseudonocardiaceae bacterium]
MRHPDSQQRAESAAAAPALEQLRRLWEHCAAPGRPMTEKGNLRLADGRHLVELLETGDIPDVEDGDYRRTLRSADELPLLSWLVAVALEAGVLRRYRGRLVAVARWAEVGPTDALDRLVDAAVELGLADHNAPDIPGLAPVLDLLDDGGPGRLLAELLEWRAAGKPTPVEELEELLCEGSHQVFPRAHPLQETMVHSWARRHVERLAALGVLTVRDVAYETDEWEFTEAEGGLAELTPAGVAVAVRLAEELGITVLAQPDPATASAAGIVELVGRVPLEQWQADVAVWVQHRDGQLAAQQLVATLSDPAQPGFVVLTMLTELEQLVGEHARPAVETLLEGPHDGFAVGWLINVGALTPEDVGQERMVASGVDTLAVTLEVGGPEELVALFGGEPADQIALLEQLWRVERPGTQPILEAVGAHHPDRAVAKTARKCLLRHRSRVANNRSSPRSS